MPLKSARDFLQLESVAGLLLMGSAILALYFKNSDLAHWYQGFLDIPVSVSIGGGNISKPLLLWVNDGLMALFFLMVALEIKIEFIDGQLQHVSQWSFPGIAAAGGMFVPALIFVYMNAIYETALNGWAIPTATDIAFALGILSLFGSRVPTPLKVFLMTFAILDDLAAIIIIAVFYTANLSFASMALAGMFMAILFLLNRLQVRRISAYALVGILLWVCVLKSGVHATLAGVVVAFLMPLKVPDVTHTAEGEARIERHMGKELIESLHPWVAFLIVPVFAFMNSGVSFKGLTFENFLSPVCLGIILGLFVGKQLGVFGFTWLGTKLGLTRLPKGMRWRELYAGAVLGGVGFTMSLFIATLAYEGMAARLTLDARLGILSGSFLSIIYGCLLLHLCLPKKRS